MNFSKGQYVRHPQKPDWGVGQIIEEIQETKVRVDFENAGKRKLDLAYVNLEPVPDSEAEKLRNRLAEKLRNRLLDPLAPHPTMNMDKVKSLCERFITEWQGSRKGYDDAGVAKEILADLSQFGRLKLATYKTLAKWCHTGGYFSGGIPIAQEISLAIFGRVIEREE